MPSISLAPLSGRYLSFAEREEIAILRVQGVGVRQIARQLGRDASTISRELRRNAATRGGRVDHSATATQWHADRQARRPKVAKLAANDAFRRYEQDRLAATGCRCRWEARCRPTWTQRSKRVQHGVASSRRRDAGQRSQVV
jgi:IS30 family transposase